MRREDSDIVVAPLQPSTTQVHFNEEQIVSSPLVYVYPQKVFKVFKTQKDKK
jgi:hypothetical protein